MVSVFFADTVSAKARHTSTMTSIILASPCGDRETMQASSAYSCIDNQSLSSVFSTESSGEKTKMPSKLYGIRGGT